MKIIKTNNYNQEMLFNPEDYKANIKPLIDPKTVKDKPVLSGNTFNDLDDFQLGRLNGYNVEKILKENNNIFKKIKLKNEYFFILKNYIIEEDGSYHELNEWINSVYDPFGYIEQKDFNKEFWSEVDYNYVLYHGTSEENIENIKKNGLITGNETRGIANRGTGSAIFLTSNKEVAESYTYPDGKILTILVGKMKKDGYMPNVSLEEPIEEKIAYEALAHKIGLNNFNYEIESGIDETTVIFYDNIPKEYIVF